MEISHQTCIQTFVLPYITPQAYRKLHFSTWLTMAYGAGFLQIEIDGNRLYHKYVKWNRFCISKNGFLRSFFCVENHKYDKFKTRQIQKLIKKQK